MNAPSLVEKGSLALEWQVTYFQKQASQRKTEHREKYGSVPEIAKPVAMSYRKVMADNKSGIFDNGRGQDQRGANSKLPSI
jgi:hypothetical protein